MLKSVDVKPNRSKREIHTIGRRMAVHNLNVNSGRPTLCKKERARIRAAVKQCEEMASIDRSSEEYKEIFQSVSGRVVVMERLHKNEAKKYRERLRAIKPTSKAS